jgi:hypothetical protein
MIQEDGGQGENGQGGRSGGGHGGGQSGPGGGHGNPGQGHTVTIIVEGTPHRWSKERINYDEVVTLEVPDYAQHQEITYSVKYKNGPSDRPEDTLAKGESVKVKDGMIFYVSETGQS